MCRCWVGVEMRGVGFSFVLFGMYVCCVELWVCCVVLCGVLLCCIELGMRRELLSCVGIALCRVVCAWCCVVLCCVAC